MSLIGGPLREILGDVGRVWSYTWWFIIPLVLAPFFWGMWLWYIRKLWVKNLSWVLLRVRVPRDILKTPKAMEQVFAAAHGTYSFGIRPFDAYWKGEIESWTSFEIMADAEGPRFYIQVLKSSRKLIESSIYAQYPDAEIEEAEDYIELFPTILPNDTYDLHGADFKLVGEDAYPIRTYEYFDAKEEEEKLDTIAPLMEALSHHAGDETTWIQFLIRPTSNEWIKKAQKERDKLLKSEDKGVSVWQHLTSFFKNAVLVFFLKDPNDKETGLKWPEPEKGEKKKTIDLTLSDKDKIEAIDKKTAKIAFETIIRWVYIDRKERLDAARTRGITAWARQFTDVNLNAVGPYVPSMTMRTRAPFKAQKTWYKKRMIYDNYRKRRFVGKYSILNIEELATLYHFPSKTVQAPGLARIEAKKGTPPGSLPVE